MVRGRGLRFVAVGGAIASALFFAPNILAQSSETRPADAPRPAFEVTSVKRELNEATMVRLGGPDVSRFVADNITMKDLIEFSYNIRDFQLSGGPDWIGKEKFDVDGKVEDSLAERLRALSQEEQLKQERLMVQALLADRFKLAVSHETKELPIFTLVAAKGEPKLKAVAAPDPQSAVPFPGPPRPGDKVAPGGIMVSILPGNKMTIMGTAAPISKLANMLSVMLGRYVDDRTGLKGSYNFLLSYTRDPSLDGGVVPGVSRDAAQNPGGTSLFTALKEQLGLKLKSTKGPVETIVIEHIEEPSAN